MINSFKIIAFTQLPHYFTLQYVISNKGHIMNVKFKNIGLALLTATLLLGLSGCGEDDKQGDTPEAPNTNMYDLRAINKTTGISALLKGGYSNGVKGSLNLVRLDAGDEIINGIEVKKVKTDTSITLDNGYSSQSSAISFVDTNGFLRAVYEVPTTCALTTDAQVLPTNATIGATSNGTAIYSCDDNTNRTISWNLEDGSNGNAKYISKSVITGVKQSESTTTLTITPDNKIVHYKVFVHIIANDITGSFEGDVN